MEENKSKLSLPCPEKMLDKFLTWFDDKKRIAFIAAILVGIITHIVMITNTVMSQDGIWNSMQYSRANDWETVLGRWGIELVTRLVNFIAIPSITTVFCIVAMSIVSVLIVDIFEFKSKFSAAFTGIILVVSPVFTATLLYVYTTVAYIVNMLLAVLAIWFIYKFKYKKLGVILSAICFIFSLSIYQSYMGVTVGLCIMISIIHLIKDDSKIKDVFINIGRTILAVLVGGIFYYILTNLILHIKGLELASYQGLEKIGIGTIFSSLGVNIVNTYKNFIEFFFGDSIVYNSNYRRDIWYALLFLSLAIMFIVKLVKFKAENKKEKAIKIILACLMFIVLPIGLNIVNIIALTEIYVLTGIQMMLIVPFSLAIFEFKESFNITKWMTIAACMCVCGTYYLAANASYTALELTYNQAQVQTIKLFDRIENTPGYNKEMPFVMAGIIGNNNFPRTLNLYGYTIGEIANNTVFHGTYGGQIGTWINYVRVFHGVDIEMCDEKTYYDIVTSDMFKEMNIFPAENSIKIKDGVVVVKLSNEPPLPY